MEQLQPWFTSLDPTMQIFWACAIGASLVFLVQMVLTFMGMEHSMDFDVPDVDVDTMDLGGGMSLFSIRSLVNFFVGFGWAGISFNEFGLPTWLLYVLSIIVGLGFGYLYIFIRRKMMRLEHNGAFRLEDCMGTEADVYLRIPQKGEGRGKVQISLNGSVHEFDAVSTGGEIKTGERVRIVKVEGSLLTVVAL